MRVTMLVRRPFAYLCVLAPPFVAMGCLSLAGVSDFRVDESVDAATREASVDAARPDTSTADGSSDSGEANDAPIDAPLDAPVDAPAISPGLSALLLPGTGVGVGESIPVTLTARNDTGDLVPRVGSRVTFTATGGTSVVTFGAVTDLGDGRYRANVTGVMEGTKLAISAMLDGVPLRTPPPSLRVANPISAGLTFSVDAANADGAGNFGGKNCPASGRTSWTSLSPGALAGTLVGFATPCALGSGWNGTGTPEDPARLTFDGVDDHVSFGAVNSLAKYTVVVWARKTGAGTLGNSGTGGLPAIFPILSKGTAEAENPNIDINYYLGIDELGHFGSDYEQAVTSVNTPLTGTAVLRDDTWYMLASTLDATAGVRATSVNATVDATLAPVAGPALGPSSLFVIGGSNRSNGVGVGRFKGDVALVLTYDRVLSAPELETTCHAYSARFGLHACPN